MIDHTQVQNSHSVVTGQSLESGTPEQNAAMFSVTLTNLEEPFKGMDLLALASADRLRTKQKFILRHSCFRSPGQPASNDVCVRLANLTKLPIVELSGDYL